MQQLFEMNAHGDIWQAPQLGDTVEPFTVTSNAAEHRARVAEHHAATVGYCHLCRDYVHAPHVHHLTR